MTDPNQSEARTETTVSTTITLPDAPQAVFEQTVAELETSLRRRGLRFEPGDDGRIVQDEFEVGRVETWEPGERVGLEWRQASWAPDEVTTVSLVFEAVENGTRVTLEHRGWGGLIEDRTDLAGWAAENVLTPPLAATTPDEFGAWLTDRQARMPAGETARSTDSDPQYHYPVFQRILSELELRSDDHLLEVGCGGGAFLEQALTADCRAAGIDHSHEMVRVARRCNRDAVDDGRLQVEAASADALPFDDATFTCATMSKVLGFLDEPVAVLEEIHRVLEDGGRIVIEGSDPELRETDAVSEPLTSRLQWYESDDLERMARDAGFERVRVGRHDLQPIAREVGIPADHRSVFDYRVRLLCARKR